jgi:murein DD-endopeptidase MepM/ murein hydrolase activator NlpD
LNDTYNPGRSFTLKSAYGDRADLYKANTREFHAGVDYGAPAGTPIPAATSGVVVYSGRNSGYGNTVIVRNATGDYSLYAHMQDGDRATVGQRIWPGDMIGQVGSTGALARGNHLHYSILPASAGKDIESPNLRHDGGPIGIKVNEANTNAPCKSCRAWMINPRRARIFLLFRNSGSIFPLAR